MKTKYLNRSFLIIIMMIMISSSAVSAGLSGSLKEQVVNYSSNGVTMKGVLVWNPELKGPLPAVIVVHEWWGLNDYAIIRARMLAGLGYIAFAADMFGDGKVATNPTEAMALAKPFYTDAPMMKTRLDAAITRVKEFPQTDKSRIAAIGYCFGGSVVLNSAKLGSDLKGVVSFHGGLKGVPVNKDLLKASILVCHGGADKSVSMEDYNSLKHSLDSIGADNTFRVYEGATHAFTNPESTANGKKFNIPIEYNEKADKESWNEMKEFLAKVFKK